jgi:hypothetical protein
MKPPKKLRRHRSHWRGPDGVWYDLIYEVVGAPTRGGWGARSNLQLAEIRWSDNGRLVPPHVWVMIFPKDTLDKHRVAEEYNIMKTGRVKPFLYGY